MTEMTPEPPQMSHGAAAFGGECAGWHDPPQHDPAEAADSCPSAANGLVLSSMIDFALAGLL